MVEKVDQVEKRNIFTRVSIFHRGREHTIKLILFIGALVAILTYIYITFLKADIHTIQYSPEDIVYDQPLRAVHDMNAVSAAAVLNLAPGNSSSIPMFVLSENYFDFGIVDSNRVLTRTFVVANHGTATLMILNAYTTCGCVTADFSATEIPPGKVALISLQFDPGFHDLRGTTVRRGVVLSTNDPDHPSQEIWIQASIR